MDCYLGTIMPFPYNFVPQGWLPCDGRLLNCASYGALSNLLGTLYGGDGRTNFGIPNLNGATPMVVACAGKGQGLSARSVGQTTGESMHALTLDETPSHTHRMLLLSSATRASSPTTGSALADPAVNVFQTPAAGALASLDPRTVMPSGAGEAHDNEQPTLALVWCICVSGEFPVRPS